MCKICDFVALPGSPLYYSNQNLSVVSNVILVKNRTPEVDTINYLSGLDKNYFTLFIEMKKTKITYHHCSTLSYVSLNYTSSLLDLDTLLTG